MTASDFNEQSAPSQDPRPHDVSCGEAVETDEYTAMVRGSTAFDVLEDADVAYLSSRMRACDFRAGATLFYEDDECDGVYFLCEGSIEVFKSDQTGKKLPLTILHERGLLGEMGLLNLKPRTATARALSPARALFLNASDFHDGLASGSVPMLRLSHAFARVLATRLSSMDERLFQIFENASEFDRYEEINAWKQRLLNTWTSLSLEGM